MGKQKRSKAKRTGSVAIASVMTLNGLVPYAVLNVNALENTQNQSTVSQGSTANLLNKLNEMLKLSHLSADEVLAASGNFKNSKTVTNKITQNGYYKVAANTSLTDMTISANVTIWIPKGVTLTINASNVATRGSNNSNPGYAGKTALTITSGVNVTFVGEGTIDVTGGVGGLGGTWNMRTTKPYGSAGGAGGTGGIAINNSGNLTFANTFTGTAYIKGGTGGTGGRGEDSSDNNINGGSTSPYLAGPGGAGGTGGVAINNSGTITLASDVSQSTLASRNVLSTGNIAIKGGTGGTGGDGGDAGDRSVAYNYDPPIKSGYSLMGSKSPANTGKEDDPEFSGTITTVLISRYSDADPTTYPNRSGDGGQAGKGGAAIVGGQLQINSGLSTIEGGNAGISGDKGSTASRSHYLTNGKTSYHYTLYDWTETTYLATQDAEGKWSHSKTGSTTGKWYSQNAFSTDPISSGDTFGNSGEIALKNVTVTQTAGTAYAYSGNANNLDALSSTTVKRSGGNFFAGNSSSNGYSYSGSTNTTPVKLSQLEGFENDTDKDGISDSMNYYVLNAGDTYLDANGELCTSKGILVNGKAYGSKDVFVSPQGYVYMSGITSTDKVEMQVAIGGKRIGDIGTDKKYVTSEAGIYTFTGTGTNLNSTFANDASSMDLDWLALQMNDNFAGTKTESNVQINTSYQLAAFAWAVNHGFAGAANAHVKLTYDIDLKAMYWTPIGTKQNPFIGVFDGDNHKIKNMRIQAIDNVDAYGLFGYVKGIQDGKNITSMIKNFTLTNGEYVTHAYNKTVKYNSVAGGTISGGNYTDYAKYYVNAKGDLYAGAVVGHADNTAFSGINVENVPMEVISTTGTVHLGGLTGYSGILEDAQFQTIQDVKVANSSLTAQAEGITYTGGIVGESADTDLINTKYIVDSSGTSSASGKQTTASITGTSDNNKVYASGIAGKAYTTLNNTYRTISDAKVDINGTVTANGAGDSYTGGIIGDAYDIEVRTASVKVSDMKSTSQKADAYIGGISGSIRADKTKYRSMTDVKVELSSSASPNFNIQGYNNAYLGGIAGYAYHTDSMSATIEKLKPSNVSNGADAVKEKAYAGGNIGYAVESMANSATIKIDADMVAKGESGAWASGSVGYGIDTSVTKQIITLQSIEATSSKQSSAYAGGAAGQISNAINDKNENAVLSQNNVTFSGKNITATSEGIEAPAYAGGIVGDAVNVNVYGNSISNNSASNVNAYASKGDAFAGGMAGRIDNSATDKTITISDTKINNISVNAMGVSDKVSGGESYAGGIAGKAIADNVNVTNVNVTGTSKIKANATYDVFAGRLFGHTDRITVLNSTPASGSSVTTSSIGGDSYAAGLIGKLDDVIGKKNEKPFQSTISMTGVAKTDVTSIAGKKKTSYAGGLLGDATYVQLQKASINNGITTTGTLATIKAEGQDAYVGGIAGRIDNTDSQNEIAYNSVSATSVKTDTSQVTGSIKQGGMYGQIDNVLIASSYAKNYLNNHPSASNGLHGGLFGDADNIRLIQVYGTNGNSSQNNIVTTLEEPGLAAKLTGTNEFYGVYTTQKQWAFDANGKAIDATSQGNGNIFKSCYYSGSGKPVTTNDDIWGSNQTWGANNYIKQDDTYALKEKTDGKKYYDSLAAVDFASNKDAVAKAMAYQLHFTANKNEQDLNDFSNEDITTVYEKELDYRLSYAANDRDLAGNFTYPTFTEPYFLTLAVNPGTEYGTVATESSINEPGSKKFSGNTELHFIAVPKDVPEENSFWYEFGSWSLQKVSYNTTTGDPIFASETLSNSKNMDLTFKMPKSDAVLTVNFVQKDNGIRRNINREIYEQAMAEVERRGKLSKDNPNYIDPNNINKDVLKDIYIEAGTDVLGKYIGQTNDSYRKNIEAVYDKIGDATYNSYKNYDQLKDPDRVLQQIASHIADEVFKTSEYNYAMEDGHLSKDELQDVRPDVNDTFTSKGNFKDYVTDQLTLEQQTDIYKPTVIDTSVNDQGNMIGIIDPFFNGEGTSLEYSFKDPLEEGATWTKANTSNSKYTLPLDEEHIQDADYIYLRNVNSDGFEAITRVPLNSLTTDVKNTKVNSDTSNTDIGVVGDSHDGKTQSLSTGKTEILKSQKGIEIAGGQTDKGNWYYAPISETESLSIINAQPKAGAYLEKFEVEVNGKTLIIDDDTTLTDGQIVFEGVTFKVSGDRFTKNDYTSNGMISFPSNSSIKVTSHYVNLLGEINASSSTTDKQLSQISNIIDNDKFTSVFVDNDKDAPKDITNAKKRYDALNDNEKELVQEKIAQFLPIDASNNVVGYTRSEFIDVFNAVTNIVFCESKIGVEDGQITKIDENDFTSGTWNNLSDAVKKAEFNMDGTYIRNDGNAQDEAKRLLEAADALEEAVKGLSYKVQSFTLSTNHSGWIQMDVKEKEDVGDLLKTAKLISDVSSDSYENIVRFPRQHSDVKITINKKEMNNKGYNLVIKNSNNKVIINSDGTVADGITNVEVENKTDQLIYTFKDIQSSVVYKAEFAKKVYTLLIPASQENDGIAAITNKDQKDENNQLINLQGKEIQITDMTESSDKNYVLHIDLEDGYRYNNDATDDDKKVSYTYVDASENETKKYVAINDKGEILIPKEDLAGIKDLNLSNGVRPLEKEDIKNEADRISNAYQETDYTPDTYMPLKNALEKAKEVINNNDASDEDIHNAYQTMIKAEEALTRQYKIDLASSGLEIIKEDGITTPDNATGTTAKYYQNGVVKFDGNYYVQEGYGVYLTANDSTKATLGKQNEIITEISYTENSTNDKKAVIRSDGYSAYIPSVNGSITNIVKKSDHRQLNIVEDTMVDDMKNPVNISGEIGEQETSIIKTIYHAPDVTTTNLEKKPIAENIVLNGKDAKGNDKKVTVAISNINSDDPSTKVKVTIALDGKIPQEIILTDDELAQITSKKDESNSKWEVEVPGTLLDKIIEDYIQEDPTVELNGPFTVDKTTVTYTDNSTVDPSGTSTGDDPKLEVTDNNSGNQTQKIQTPAYILTPDVPYITTAVVVDENKVVKPNDTLIQQIKNGNETPDGTYTYTDSSSGDKYVLVYDKANNKPLTVSVKPLGMDYNVTFNVDPDDNTAGDTADNHIKDTKYGEAVIAWDNDKNDAHIVSGEFEKKQYDVVVKGNPTQGTVTSDKSKVVYDEDVVLTLKANEGNCIEPTASVSLQVNGETIETTVSELQNQAGVDVEMIRNDDGDLVEVKITTKNNNSQVSLETKDDLFRSKNPTDIINGMLNPSVDKLKNILDIVAEIEAQKENSPYVTGDSEYKSMQNIALNGHEILDQLLGDDGELIKKIKDAKTEKELLEVLNPILKDDADSMKKICDHLDDVTKSIQKAINNLNAKDESKREEQIVVTLPENVTIGNGAKDGIDSSVIPNIIVKDTTGKALDKNSSLVTDGNQKLVIEPIDINAGYELNEMTLTMKNPETGEVKTVVIPLTPETDGSNDTLKFTVDGEEKTINNITGIYPMLSGDVGQTSIQLPGNVIDDIFKEAFGKDVIGGIIDDIELSKVNVLDEMTVKDKHPSTDAGIDTSNNTEPDLFTNSTAADGTTTKNETDQSDKIELTNEGISVENIKVKDDFAMKGMVVTVKDDKNQLHDIFIPSTSENTKISSSDKLDMVVPQKELADAISAQLSDVKLDDLKVVDVTISTYPPLKTDEVEVEKSQKITETGITIQDKDGGTLEVVVPTDKETPDKVTVIKKNENGEVIETKDVNLTNPEGEVKVVTNPDTGKQHVEITGDLVKDILDTLQKDTNKPDTSNIDLSVIPEIQKEATKERIGNTIIDKMTTTPGIMTQIDKDHVLTGKDDKPEDGTHTSDQLLDKDESLVIENIMPSYGYIMGNVDITLKGKDKDGVSVEKKVELKVDENGQVTAWMDGKEIENLPSDSLKATLPNGSVGGKVEVGAKALEEIYKAAGINKGDKDQYYDADITDITVHATLDETKGISVPHTVDKDASQNMTSDPQISVTPSIVLPDIDLNKDASDKKVTITVSDNQGNEVNIVIDNTNPDDKKITVTPKGDTGGNSVEVKVDKDLLDKIESFENDDIKHIPGDVLQDIIESYNKVASKDVNDNGDAIEATIPLKLPYITVDDICKSNDTSVRNNATISGGEFIDGALVGNEDIHISPIQVKPAHELSDVTVTTKDKAGNEIKITLPVNPNPNVDSGKVQVVVKTSDGEKSYEITTDMLKDIVVSGKDENEITIPGKVVKDIIDKTVDLDSVLTEKNPEITSVCVDAVRSGSHVSDNVEMTGEGIQSDSGVSMQVIHRKDDTIENNAILLPDVSDLLIGGLKVEDGYKPDTVTLTLKNNDGQEYQVQIPTKTDNVTEIKVTQPDGSITTIPVKDKNNPDSTGIDLSQVTLNKESPYEIRISGETVKDIVMALDSTQGKDAPLNMDITKTDVHVSGNTWILPLSEKIVSTSNSNVVQGIQEVKSIIVKNSENSESSQINDDKALVIEKDGIFTMIVNYGEDDYQTIKPNSKSYEHVYDGLIINDTRLTRQQLAGIVKENTDGSLTIDANKLTQKVAEVSNQEFKGFNSIQVATLPQNPQYNTFLNEYHQLNSMNKESENYEALVKKLLAQFDDNSAGTTNPDKLTLDNAQHLVDYKADLLQQLNNINLAKKVEELAKNIKDLYEQMDKTIDEKDGDKSGLPFNYGTDEKVSTDVINTVEDYRGKIEALEKEYDALNKDAQKSVNEKTKADTSDPLDTATKLQQMLDAIEKVDNQTMTRASVVNQLMDEILSITLPDIRDDNDGTSIDTYATAKNKLQDLDTLNKKVEKVQSMLNSMTKDELKDVSSQKRKEIQKLAGQISDEYEDFANLFTKEYLTTDQQVYDTGKDSDGTSAQSVNGLKEKEAKSKSSLKNKVIEAKIEFDKLSDGAKAAIGIVGGSTNGVFYGPTLDELFDAVVEPVNALKVLEDKLIDEYNKLLNNAHTQAEKDALKDVYDKAKDELENGAKTQDKSLTGNDLDKVLDPTSDDHLKDIHIKDMDRHPIHFITEVSYVPQGETESKASKVDIEFTDEGYVKTITIDDVDKTDSLTEAQRNLIKITVPQNDTKGDAYIPGTLLEELLGIQDATDKAITKLDMTLSPLRTSDLTQIVDKANEDMGNIARKSAKEELSENGNSLKDKTKEILSQDIIAQIDDLVKDGLGLIDKLYAEDAHDIAHDQIKRIEDLIIQEIKKQLANDYSDAFKDLSKEGQDKLDQLYKDVLNQINHLTGDDRIDKALELLKNAQKDIKDLVNLYPVDIENPNDPDTPDEPDTPVTPDVPNTPNEPVTPETPNVPKDDGNEQKPSVPGISLPEIGSSGLINQVTSGSQNIHYNVSRTGQSVIVKDVNSKTSIQERLEQEYQRILKDTNAFAHLSGYGELNDKLTDIYKNALERLETASEEDYQTILDKAYEEMQNIEKEMKALKESDSKDTNQNSDKQNTKQQGAWFNIFAVILLLLVGLLDLLKRHKLSAIMSIDFVVGAVLLFVTQGFNMIDMSFFNVMSILFALLCIIDAILLFLIYRRKDDNDQ